MCYGFSYTVVFLGSAMSDFPHSFRSDAIMNLQRLFGIVLLVIGVVILIIGMNSSNSFADQISDIFRARFTESTTWYIVGGISLGLLGLGVAVLPGRVKSA